MLYAVIMVGGAGTRLWPRSRARRPKQLMKIDSDENLMRECLHRALALTPAERVIIITTAELEALCREQLPEVPAANVIAEPQGRDTAAAVGLAAVHVRARDPGGVMVVLPADHLIRPVDRFAGVLGAAAQIATERRCIVTTGIVPRSPATAYGYIQRGEALGTFDGAEAYRQVRFREKPDRATAEQYIAGGDHYWNSGIFTWRADVILDAFAAHAPELRAQLDEIAAAIGTGTENERRVLAAVYGRLKKISVDYAIMEHVRDVVVVEADFEWDDVGSWTAVGAHLPRDAAGNAVDGEFIGIDCEDLVVLSRGERTIAAVGLRGLVIVDDGDVVFICPKEKDQDVKRLVAELKARGRDDLL